MGEKIIQPNFYNYRFYNTGGGGGGGGGVDVSDYFSVTNNAIIIKAYKIGSLLHIHYQWKYIDTSSPIDNNFIVADFSTAPFKFTYKFQTHTTGCYDDNRHPNDRTGWIGNWKTTDGEFYTNKLVIENTTQVRFWYADFVVQVDDV